MMHCQGVSLTTRALEDIALGTRKAYGYGWKHWELFAKTRGVSPFLEEHAARLPFEDEILLFMVHQHDAAGVSWSAIKTKLFGIRFAHQLRGCPEPVVGRPRVWRLLNVFRQKDGERDKRFPVYKLPVALPDKHGGQPRHVEERAQDSIGRGGQPRLV